jgi:hypothetical protein
MKHIRGNRAALIDLDDRVWMVVVVEDGAGRRGDHDPVSSAWAVTGVEIAGGGVHGGTQSLDS